MVGSITIIHVTEIGLKVGLEQAQTNTIEPPYGQECDIGITDGYWKLLGNQS